MTAELKSENKIKSILCNGVRELPVTLEELKIKAEVDEFIIKMKIIVKSEETNKKCVKLDTTQLRICIRYVIMCLCMYRES